MMKAVIPVAGLGTRMLPATKSIPKEMLPIVDRPLIQYIVEECAQAGVEEIILVTHSSKNSIADHFDTSFELENMLEQRIKNKLLEEVRSICPDNVKIVQIRQGHALGLGHAICCARPVIGNNPFIVLLPDVLLNAHYCDPQHDNLSAMIKRFEKTERSQIMVEPVPMSQVQQYGVVDCEGVFCPQGNWAPIRRIVEKPNPEDAPSNLSVVGRYVFSEAIWELLDGLPAGVGGEIQLTDAIDLLLKKEVAEAYTLVGKSHDCGNKLGYMKAFVEYGLHNSALKEEFASWMQDFCEKTLLPKTEVIEEDEVSEAQKIVAIF
ncbi:MULTISPECIES: UTP--glucose-1-phosphate uridylyltransferase GalU [Proteus]|uniref:UTP--glucose-1-phosphate uridylyltransferase GalU n=1 Tax=Proteus TaxID=583 RepID=UPI001CC09E74|nr:MULTISPECIES: UTP--glucose-1-phosphate uridylyltransferase GalU [Proteus]MCM2368729.1 UTP--glucose-1-phosphate uridylyltransferase GalU [Proteus sp. FZP2095]MCO4180346.1 UTP--glucose-1-phosphate uridylyltransferase GalU [Proteus terrae]MCO4190120.1 UTP--glucose-1-phosphate uridylyltransferase GalU [Proteus terrae]UDF25953.1 UTP--glucose-1-phosphate uridylyltransferase GalU [Proteus terrae subsp. cibarius]WCG86861.1 UTP--glucose-1-phosphate uridylyltransferase GalU [Proteus terrae]